MTIREIYTKYQIIPSLQLHQYRVAAVGLTLAKSMVGVHVDSEEVVRACLLHDMGNIIKFNMTLFPDFFEPEGVTYWANVKREFMHKYGPDEHDATIAIAEELLISNIQFPISKVKNQFDPHRILELIEAIGFSNAKTNWKSNDFSAKIAAYSDMRVEPHGVTSLEKRLEDGNKRFKLNKPDHVRQSFFEEMAAYLELIEGQIFEKCTIVPSQITEPMVQKSIPAFHQIEL